MPIEFACEFCQKLLRVPDGTGGNSCECPSCETLLEIPDPDAIEIIEAVDESSSQDQLTLPCPKCRYNLVCPTSLLGTKGQCRKCKYIFLISTDADEVGSAAEAQSTSLVFTCPKCEQLFEGTEQMQGRKGKCHACGEVFAIELTEAEQPSTPAPPALPQLEKQSEKLQTNPSPAAAIQLACSNCQGVMEVPASAAGQTTACPYCQQLLHIPAAE